MERKELKNKVFKAIARYKKQLEKEPLKPSRHLTIIDLRTFDIVGAINREHLKEFKDWYASKSLTIDILIDDYEHEI